MHGVAVAVAVLGALRVSVDDVDATPTSPKAKALVAFLALRCGEVVSVDRLGDELWPELPPDRARRVVQVRVAEVRKLFASAGASSLVEFVAPGYRMALPRDAIDVNRFSDLVVQAQQSDDRIDAMTMLREALGRWSGDALAEAQANYSGSLPSRTALTPSSPTAATVASSPSWNRWSPLTPSANSCGSSS